MNGRFARYRHGFHVQAVPPTVCTRQFDFTPEGKDTPRDLAGKSLKGPVEDVALGKAALDARGGIDDERMGLAQGEQAQGVVEIAVGEHDGLDGTVPRPTRM